MSYREARALQQLLKQYNQAWPGRPTESDGWIGDANHASRDSDHNPWVKGSKGVGVVTARDFTSYTPEGGGVSSGRWLVNQLMASKDPRIKYVIFEGRIYRSYAKGSLKPWTGGPYSGPNPHNSHVHVSVNPEPRHYDSAAVWGSVSKPKENKPVSKDVSPGRAVAWNAQVGRPKKRVRAGLRLMIKASDYPAFVAGQEFRTYRALVEGVAKNQRYRVFQPRDVGKAQATVRAAGYTMLMVHNQIKILGHGELRMTKTWRGPKGRSQEGRVFPWAKIMLRGQETLVVSVHMPWGRNLPGNRGAWNETMRQLRGLVSGHEGAVILMGDWNMSPTAKGKRSVRRLAKDIGGQVSHDGKGADYAVIRGVSGKLTKGAKRGSDHRLIRLRQIKKK